MRRVNLFGTFAALAILLALVAMALGKANTTDAADYVKHSRAVFGDVLEPGYPFDYAVYRPPFFGAVLALVGEISQKYQAHITIIINLLVALGAMALVFSSLPLSTIGKVVAVALMFANIWFFREMFLLRETAWYTLFCALFVVICQRLYLSPLLGICLGVVCGLAMLTRPTGPVFLVAAVLMIAAFHVQWRRTVLNLAGLIVVTGVILLPWQIYLHQKFDRIQITGSCSGGFTMFKGNHPIMGNLEPAIDLDAADDFLWDYAQRHIHSDSLCARSDFLGAEARAAMKMAPLHAVESFAAGLAYILAPMPVPLGAGQVSFNGTELQIVSFHPRPSTSYVSVFYYAGVYVMAFIGLLFSRREHWRWTAPVLLLILGHVCIYAMTLAEIRFRMPFEPFLCVLAAVAAQRLLESRWPAD